MAFLWGHPLVDRDLGESWSAVGGNVKRKARVNARLRPMLDALVDDRSDAIRRVLLDIAEAAVARTPTAEVARRAGLRDRDELYTTLRRAGLPPFTRLARLVRTLNWLLEAEDSNVTLSRLARDDQRYASQCSREVRATLGIPWRELRERGSGWLVAQISSWFA